MRAAPNRRFGHISRMINAFVHVERNPLAETLATLSRPARIIARHQSVGVIRQLTTLNTFPRRRMSISEIPTTSQGNRAATRAEVLQSLGISSLLQLDDDVGFHILRHKSRFIHVSLSNCTFSNRHFKDGIQDVTNGNMNIVNEHTDDIEMEELHVVTDCETQEEEVTTHVQISNDTNNGDMNVGDEHNGHTNDDIEMEEVTNDASSGVCIFYSIFYKKSP